MSLVERTLAMTYRASGWTLEAALAAIDNRLAAGNEIKGAMKDAQAMLPTRSEMDARLKPLETSDSAQVGRREARVSSRLDAGFVVGLAGVVIAIIAVILRG